MPERVQRKRTKGWRMPANTVYVGRGSRWGNPFKVGNPIWGKETKTPLFTAAQAVDLYSKMLMPYSHNGPHNTTTDFLISIANMEDIQMALRGKNLACFCPLGQPCHADILLTIANSKAVK